MPVGFWLQKQHTKKLSALKDLPWLSKDYVGGLLAAFYRNPQNYLKVWSLVVLNEWLKLQGMELAP